MTSTPEGDGPPGALARYWEDKRQPLLMLAVAAVVVAVAMLFLALTGGEEEDTTWDAAPSLTTCKDYLEVMNDDQRTDIASKMLHALRAKDALTAPADGLVSTFEGGLGTACEGGVNLRMDEVGASLYLTERAKFGR